MTRLLRVVGGDASAAPAGDRRGWTLIELLVAVSIAVVAAGMVVAVFHALTGGLASSALAAARYHSAVTGMERILRDWEAGLADETARRAGGWAPRLRSEPGTAAADLAFMARVPHPLEADSNRIVYLRYRLEADDGDVAGHRLIRVEWEATDDGQAAIEPDDALRETLLSGVAGFHADVLASGRWWPDWPPDPEPANGDPAPAVMRVAVRLAPGRAGSLSVTGTAWRTSALLIPVTAWVKE